MVDSQDTFAQSKLSRGTTLCGQESSSNESRRMDGQSKDAHSQPASKMVADCARGFSSHVFAASS